MEHIATPLGTVGLWLDGRPWANHGAWERIDASGYARLHPVDGNWRIAYWHEPDGGAHTLECRLDPAVECEGGSASGERLEATEVDGGKTVLVIAVEYDFKDYAHGHGQYEYDHIAATDDFGAIVELPVDARAQWVVFGVSWVEDFDEESGVNPWLVGDPGGDRLKLAASVQKGHAVADTQLLPQACEWEVGSGIDLTKPQVARARG